VPCAFPLATAHALDSALSVDCACITSASIAVYHACVCLCWVELCSTSVTCLSTSGWRRRMTFRPQSLSASLQRTMSSLAVHWSPRHEDTRQPCRGSAVSRQCAFRFDVLFCFSFWVTLCKMVCPVLSDRCLSVQLFFSFSLILQILPWSMHCYSMNAT